MKLETFSYLPPLSREQVEKQVRFIIEKGLIPAIEYTYSPGPGETYWTMWDLPLFDVRDPEEVLKELDACREAHPGAYVKLIGYDARRQGQVVSFVVHRPS